MPLLPSVPWWRVVGWTLPFVFRRLRKIAESDSFLMSVCPAVLMEQLPFHWTDFYKIRYLSIFFENLFRNIKFHWNRTRLAGAVHKDQYTFLIISRSVLLRMRNVSDKSCRGTKTHILYSVTFSEEIMWKNMVEPNRPQMAIRRMRFACWIAKATHTHSLTHSLTHTLTHTHTHPHTRTLTHTHSLAHTLTHSLAHAHTHTHTHSHTHTLNM